MKPLFYIALTILLIIIGLNNRQQVPFWFFGERSVSLTLLMGITSIMGLVIGMAAFARKKARSEIEDDGFTDVDEEEDTLNEEDRDYIS